ncbi:MAG: serine hydrolase [Bacteroidales bacterium]|nr:serine hydrolase [Bacteroidales bacterium]
MKKKFVIKNWALATIALFLVTYFCTKQITANPQHQAILEADPQADTIFKYLSLDDKIMQMYIFDARNRKPDFFDEIPSGIIFGDCNLKTIEEHTSKLGKKAKVPMINICNTDIIAKNFPNYMNNNAVLSTGCDSAILRNFAHYLADTLKKAGINAVTGFFADYKFKNHNFKIHELEQFNKTSRIAIQELNKFNIFSIITGTFAKEYDSTRRNLINKSIEENFRNGAQIKFTTSQYKNQQKYDGLSITTIEKNEEIKQALLSNNEFVTSSINPDLYLKTVKELLRKDKGKIKKMIDVKALKILRMKYQKFNTENNTQDSLFNKVYAAKLCASKSITCIKNDSKFLPIKNLNDVVIIQIGGIRQNGFLSRSSSYCQTKYYYAKNDYKEIKNAVAGNAKKNVIFLIDCKLAGKQTLDMIKAVAKSRHACVINFNHPENLNSIEAKSILQVFGNNYQSGDYLAQAVFGGLYVCGKFPFDGYDGIKQMEGVTIRPTRLQYCLDDETGFKTNYKDTIDSIVKYAIDNTCFPGCQIFASFNGKVVINKGFGHLTYDTLSRKVSTNDLYDIASLTKICATTILSIYLTGEKKLDPKANLGSYFKGQEIDWSNLPADTIFKGKDTILIRDIPKTTVYDVTIKSILEHRSGIEPYVPIYKFTYSKSAMKRCAKALEINPDELTNEQLQQLMFDEYYRDHYIKDSAEVRVTEGVWLRNNYADSLYNYIMRLKVSDKKTYKYSDVNMILLQWAEENILKCKADKYLNDNFYKPLGMRNTCYNPHEIFNKSRIAPTETDKWTNQFICGDVHDPSAALLGGVAGNAGLFSTASNLGILFQMMLNYGTYGGKRYLDSLTIKDFTSKQPYTGRALGFDMVPSKFAALTASPSTYGHTGFTGTCAWVDPENKIVIVFLSNRVHPTSNNQNINKLLIRRKICQAIYDGLGLQPQAL